jgi:hypothetical protein
MQVKFFGKKTKIGNSHFVCIPKGISDLIEEEKEYIFLIEEKKEVDLDVP